ncbi:hypothetical protein NDU88_000906, partial [Pleurodeles waltl]
MLRSSVGTIDLLEKFGRLPFLAGAAAKSRWNCCQTAAGDDLEKRCTGGLKRNKTSKLKNNTAKNRIVPEAWKECGETAHGMWSYQNVCSPNFYELPM